MDVRDAVAVVTGGASGLGQAAELAAFSKIVVVNPVGTFTVIRLAAERMSRVEPLGEERGVIVNTASAAAFDGQIGQAALPHPSRLGQPPEFGSPVAHIVAGPMLNGGVIRLDGAIRMAPR